MIFRELPEHHAVLLTHQDRKNLTSLLWEEISQTSPHHKLFDQTVLSIETARQVISWAKSPFAGKRTGIISFHTAGSPAQNALLKILEEPDPSTRFVIITSNEEALIPTVISRVMRHTAHIPESKNVYKDAATEFVITTPTHRMKLDFIKEILSATDEEKRKDREKVRTFVLTLVDVLYTKNYSPKYIQEALEVATFSSLPSSSSKALLEYLALLLPQSKS